MCGLGQTLGAGGGAQNVVERIGSRVLLIAVLPRPAADAGNLGQHAETISVRQRSAMQRRVGVVALASVLLTSLCRVATDPDPLGRNSKLGNTSLPLRPPQNPIHHLLRPRLARARRPAFSIQGITHLLK